MQRIYPAAVLCSHQVKLIKYKQESLVWRRMRDTDYKSLRRDFLGVGLTGAMVGLAGCTDSISVDTGSDDDSSEESTNQRPDLASVELSFSYNAAEQQATVEFVGGADIKAGNVQIRQGSETKVAWSDLGSTTAASDQNISPGATAVLGENILNWGQTVAEDDLIRVVYTGRDSPATLERYSPPESTDSESTVPASISGFRLESSGEQQLEVSFDSSKQLRTVEVEITGAESATLARSDFTESAPGDGTFTYSANYEAGSDGSYTATITQAVDTDGTNALNGENISDAVSLNTQEQPSDTTTPSISAFSIANPSEQQLRVSFDSNEELSIIQINIMGAESETLTRSDFSEAETSGGNYTYVATYQSDSAGEFTATLEVASDEDGNDGSNNNSVSVTIAPEAPTNGLVSYWELNNASGQIMDNAGSNNGEIIDIDSGEISEAGFGTGTALDFSDTDDYIQIPSTERLSGGQSARISVTAWIRPSESSQQVVGKQYDKSSGDWGLHVNEEAFAEDRDSSNWNEYHEEGSDNPPYLRYYSETPESGDTELLTDDISWNEWQHVGFTLDQPNNTIRLYINGELAYEVTNVPHVSANTNAPVQIGVNRYPGSEEPESSYYGLVSDVRVYDRVLSETEINTISHADDRR
jgi:hypothetical protein